MLGNASKRHGVRVQDRETNGVQERSEDLIVAINADNSLILRDTEKSTVHLGQVLMV